MNQLFMDIECYCDYFLVMFMDVDGRTKSFELYEGHPLDVDGMAVYLQSEIVTFNGIHYDQPMLSLAMSGASNARLKKASDAIITQDLKPWDFYQQYACEPVDFDHIDLIEVAPGMVGLKLYGGRMHCPKLQDLPIEPSASIAPSDRPALRLYCRNDLRVTQALYNELRGQIDLRRVMSEQLDADLRSKSDAQIAESVLRKAYIDAHGRAPRRRPITYTSFKYVAPEYIGFATPQLKELLTMLTSVDMVIKDTGHVQMPDEITASEIIIHGRTYNIGLGGIHSNESEVSHCASDTVLLRDIDVVSYYPSLMLNMGMYPPALGELFLETYANIKKERVEAKRSGDKVKDAVLKITLNGCFGKTSNQYSILYNPSMMIHTTLTGQLSLLMLIEALEHYGIPVVSANTDGVVTKFHPDQEPLLKKIVGAWERRTGLETEETNYKSIHSRDVNSYVAVKTDGKVKTKGAFASGGLAKNPQNEICAEAVVAFLSKGIKPEDTIRACTDIRKFLTLRTVTGGAVKEGYTLGKAIRWYYGDGETGAILYKKNGNLVPRSEGAIPLMDLPDTFPANVDFGWYIRECNDLLMDLGVTPRPPVVKLPRKNSKAWKEMFGVAT